MAGASSILTVLLVQIRMSFKLKGNRNYRQRDYFHPFNFGRFPFFRGFFQALRQLPVPQDRQYNLQTKFRFFPIFRPSSENMN